MSEPVYARRDLRPQGLDLEEASFFNDQKLTIDSCQRTPHFV
ncbi:hypothetical protein [Dyadobacter fanqingshengii]|nr:hypothetical protein [Dyadobacter fanqingshengii]